MDLHSVQICLIKFLSVQNMSVNQVSSWTNIKHLWPTRESNPRTFDPWWNTLTETLIRSTWHERLEGRPHLICNIKVSTQDLALELLRSSGCERTWKIEQMGKILAQKT